MKKGPIAAALARMIGRSESPTVAKLYSHAIGRPLMVHRTIGETMLRGFLRGAAFDGSGDAAVSPPPMAGQAGKIAVLNIAGPLVSRPEPGECGPGPTSYEGIRLAFDEAMDDGNVAAVILRLDSAGGLVSGCFDLTDHIFSRRGEKPIVAQVDDMAYSACYAIASACDRIQVSRTSGVGSVGVVAYHVDLSGAYEQAGVKVTYIYSGSHKVDGNPTEPLPESVKNSWQAECDSLRDLFVETVAKYRGMEASAIADTEADTYTGVASIAVGFADSVGTLVDLLAELSTPAPVTLPEQQPTVPEDAEMENESNTVAETPEQKTAREAAAAETARVNAQHAANAAKAELSDAVVASKLPAAVKTALLEAGPKEGVSASDRVAYAQTVADACVAAKLPDEASGYVKRGLAIETVRKELSEASASTTDRVDTTQRPAATGNIFAKGIARETAAHERRVGRK
jgi:signal peptide peptidase SppA